MTDDTRRKFFDALILSLIITMKTYFKALVRELIFGGHIMSLGAVSIVASFALVLGRVPDWKFLLATYLGVHSVYLFDRYKDMLANDRSNAQRTDYLKSRTKNLLVMIILFVVLSIILLSIYGGLFIALASTALFATGFSYFLLFKRFTKRIVGFKDFFVPASYILLLVIFLRYQVVPLKLSTILLLIFVYLRIFAAEVFYDLKDVKDDKAKNLLTFAVVFERRHFFLFIAVLNVISALPILAGVVMGLFSPFVLSLVLVTIYYSWYIEKAKKIKDISLLSYVFCEGEYLLWLPLILVARHFWG